jgi:hypothetical protein
MLLPICAIALVAWWPALYGVLDAQGPPLANQKRVKQLKPSAESEVTLYEAQLTIDGGSHLRLDMSGEPVDRTQDRRET